MKKYIRLLTLKYEKYTVFSHWNSPMIKCQKLKELKIEKCDVGECFNSLKILGLNIYKFNNKEITISEQINRIIVNNINKSNFQMLDDYILNFNDELFSNISNYDANHLIKWCNTYGVQNVNTYIYQDFKRLKYKLDDKKDCKDLIYLKQVSDEYNFELLPLINVSLCIYFIETILKTLKSLLNANNRSYMYNRLINELKPFPYLTNYYKNNCVQEHELSKQIEDELETKNERHINSSFISILSKYMLKFYEILKEYLAQLNLPSSEIILKHCKIETANKISEYGNMKYNNKVEHYHNILEICCEILESHIIDCSPKCLICGDNLKSSKFYCPKHIIEFGENKIKTYKGGKTEDMNKIRKEIDSVREDEMAPVPITDKYISKKLSNQKYDSKRNKD